MKNYKNTSQLKTIVQYLLYKYLLVLRSFMSNY